MSTYYTFRCPKCEEQGGFFSRQAWGWGNCEIFENFKFHVAHSGCGVLQILKEDDSLYANERERLRWLDHLKRDEDLRSLVWPRAGEWAWVKEGWSEAKDRWLRGFECEYVGEHENSLEG